MKQMIKKKAIVYFAVVCCLLVFPVSVRAAAKTAIKVKVNNSYSAVLEKTEGRWHLDTTASGVKNPFQDKVLYLKIPSGKELVTGYYTFNTRGYLDARKVFHALNTKIGTQRFKGDYYFGEENGRLYMKRGWITINGNRYCLSAAGKKYVSRWVGVYYLLENGRMARSMRTPDGFYVDCDGRKCAKNQMRLSSLKKSLDSMIRGYSGQWSVYVKDLKTGDILSINNKPMEAASVIKLFVMASTYENIKNGTLKKDASVTRLLKDMITVSDNESYNELIRRHSKKRDFLDGCKEVNKFLKTLGCTKTECHRTLHPSSTSIINDGKSNSISARDAGMVLEKIYKNKCVSANYSREMLDLLLHQTRRWKIPAGLPAGVKCANKTGENSLCQNDVAIVYGKKTDYVVCILAETGEYSGVSGIKALSAKIYSYLNA